MSKRKGVLDIRSYARQHTETAIKTLVAIAACSKANQGARVAAAQALLDRGWGKATQYIEVSEVVESIERVIVDERAVLDVDAVEVPPKQLTH